MGGDVLVIGGGVGGLSAAHELAERGFSVTLVEASPVLGGKAASQPVPGTGRDGRQDLPGEHGFRFYPAFYTHLIDTMRRIPTEDGRTVADRLIPSDEAGVAAVDDFTIFSFSRRPLAGPGDLIDTIEEAFRSVHPAPGDLAHFTARVLVYLTSCRARREAEYTRISWWDFLEADRFSPSFQGYVRAIPRTMVAMDPQRGAARTIGDISMQLLLDYGDRAHQNDRTMDGPTSTRWIDPWEVHLGQLGVRVFLRRAATHLAVEGRRIAAVHLSDGTVLRPDWVVLAVPVEAAQALVTPALAQVEPSLAALAAADPAWLTSWMVGAQYFLSVDVPLVRGHLFFPDSPWALTAISQPQFWARGVGPIAARYGDGRVHGILSVDISDWFTVAPRTGRTAAQALSRDELLDEIWAQVKDGVNSPDDPILHDAWVLHRHLDAGITFPTAGGPPRNHTPLLVHPPRSAALRPDAATRVHNLFLAADYVATATDLASMEGANEAARRAVNALLDRAGSRAPRCELWPLEEPAVFAPFRALDERRFQDGKPHLLDRAAEGPPDGLGALRARVREAFGL